MKDEDVKTVISQSFPAFCTGKNNLKNVAQMTPLNKLKWLHIY